MEAEQRAEYRHNNESEEAAGKDRGNQSVARALAILDLLAQVGDDLGVRDIARRLGLATSIVQRLITTLARYGYVEQSPSSLKYRVGYQAFRVGNSFVLRSDFAGASLPELRRLTAEHRLNAYAGVMRDGAIIYLTALQARGPITIASAPGSRAPLHSTSLGKALLAELDDAEVAALLGPEPYQRLTDRTKTTLRQILDELSEVRRLGYALCDGENIDGVVAIGAVVRDASGTAIAAISGARHRSQIEAADIAPLSEVVKAAAARISRRLGAPMAATSQTAAG